LGLSLGRIHSASTGAAYPYREAVAGRDSASYQLDSPEARSGVGGQWMGAGAERLGLSGPVAEEELRAALEGRHPRSGEQLRPMPQGLKTNGDPKSRPGFDLTFLAPKSVSVLWAGADARERATIERVFTESVRAGLSYLDRSACQVRRGRGGTERLAGQGFVAAAFPHFTTRAGDAHLHIHAMTANFVEGADGRISAPHDGLLYAHGKTAGYIQERAFRDGLTNELGWRWTDPVNGIAQVVGVPEAATDSQSRRSHEVGAHLEETGGQGPRAAQSAAHATRRPKDYGTTPDRLREEQLARIEEAGFGRRERARVGLDRGPQREPASKELEALSTRLEGPEGLTKMASTFDRRAVVMAFAEAGHGGPGGRQSQERIEALADRWLETRAVPVDRGNLSADQILRLASGRVVAVAAGTRYTSNDMLEIERKLLEHVEVSRGARHGQASRAEVERAISRRADRSKPLTEEQVGMVQHVTLSEDSIVMVRGEAGTGKTFALDAAREAWESSGHNVYGAALSNRAAGELEDGAGIASTSVALLCARLEQGRLWLHKGDRIVVDETGMLGTRQLATILAHARDAGARVVLCGDDRQIAEIEAGGAYTALCARLGAAELTEVRRQEDPRDIEAARAIWQGRGEEFLRSYEERGRLTVGADADETRDAMVSDWWQGAQEVGVKEAIMIAHARSDVYELNAMARELMRLDGRLGKREVTETGADGRERSFAVGDRIVERSNDRRRGTVNGARGEVVDVRGERVTVEVLIKGEPTRHELDGAYLRGDAKRATPGLEHGYAGTGHHVQGATVQRAYVRGGGPDRRWLYTAVTRHVQEARLYVNGGIGAERSAPGQEIDSLAEVRESLSRSGNNELASDIMAREGMSARRKPSAELRRTEGERAPLEAAIPRREEAALKAADGEIAKRQSTLEKNEKTREQLEERAAYLERERAGLGRFARSERASYAGEIAGTRQAVERLRGEEAKTAEDAKRVREGAEKPERTVRRWWRGHGPSMRELVASRVELGARERGGREAKARAAAYEPSQAIREAIGERPGPLEGRKQWERVARRIESYQQRAGQRDGRLAAPDRERVADAVRARRDTAMERSEAATAQRVAREHVSLRREHRQVAKDVDAVRERHGFGKTEERERDQGREGAGRER
jgi:conjugative relaxase-like TrwC/TraI family protein